MSVPFTIRCCHPQVTSGSSLASVTLPHGLASSSTLHHLSHNNPCQHSQHLPPYFHPQQQHPLSHLSRATTLPCGMDPRLISCSSPSSSHACHNHANHQLSATDANPLSVFQHSHPAMCASQQHLHRAQAPVTSCCSYIPQAAPACCASDSSAALMQRQMQMQEAPASIAAMRSMTPGAHVVPNPETNVWAAAQQMRMPSGRFV